MSICGHDDCFTCPYPDCSPKYYGIKKSVQVDRDKLIALHSQNMTDIEMSRALNCSRTTIVKWRERFGLSINYSEEPRGRKNAK